jgi:hypothetical protein
MGRDQPECLSKLCAVAILVRKNSQSLSAARRLSLGFGGGGS